MTDKSVFTDKKVIPVEDDLSAALGVTYKLWNHIRDYVFTSYPDAQADGSIRARNSDGAFE